LLNDLKENKKYKGYVSNTIDDINIYGSK
jgi:hypothetical protein